MKRYIFNIEQRHPKTGAYLEQNVWTSDRIKSEAEDNIQSEYWGIISMTLIRIEDI